jgi:secondary thiamine-phosphate synthase enzyme
MITELVFTTAKKEEFINITGKIQKIVSKEKVKDGTVIVYVPHTTAGLTLNENADPDVVRDILFALERSIPDTGFKHKEGNSTAHIKSTLMGVSKTILIKDGVLLLGRWQGLYFCEFFGPRERKIIVKVSSDQE